MARPADPEGGAGSANRAPAGAFAFLRALTATRDGVVALLFASQRGVAAGRRR